LLLTTGGPDLLTRDAGMTVVPPCPAGDQFFQFVELDPPETFASKTNRRLYRGLDKRDLVFLVGIQINDVDLRNDIR
jgi:hypothetical protein